MPQVSQHIDLYGKFIDTRYRCMPARLAALLQVVNFVSSALLAFHMRAEWSRQGAELTILGPCG